MNAAWAHSTNQPDLDFHVDADFDYTDTKVLILMKRIYCFYDFYGFFFQQAWYSERAELLFIPGRALAEWVLGGHQHQNAVTIPRCAVFRRSRKHLRVLSFRGLSMRQIEENILSFPLASQSDLKGSTGIFQCRFLLVFPQTQVLLVCGFPYEGWRKEEKARHQYFALAFLRAVCLVWKSGIWLV